MSNQVTPFRDLKIDDIRKLIDEGYEVVDVREDWEWKKGHLPGARHVVLNAILANPTAQKFRDRTIFGCAVGERSAVAPESTVKPEEVIEVLRQCFDPEIPVNIIDLGLVYDIAIKPERVDVKMTL